MTKADELSNPRAELALLGTVVRAKPEQRVQMMLRVREDWFSSEQRAAAWRVIHDMVNRTLPVDITLLEDGLRPLLPDGPRAEIVRAITEAMPTASVWATLADRVEDYYMRRRGLEACRAAMARFNDLKTPAGDALDSAEADLFALHNQRQGVGMMPIGHYLPEAVNKIQEAVSNRGYVTGGLPTGWTELDRINIGGMRPGHVIIIAAPPGGGKTVALMDIASNVAMGEADYHEAAKAREKGFANYLPNSVGIYSLEMDGASLAQRLIITRSKVMLNKMQRGQMSRKEQEDIERAYRQLLNSRLHVDHCPGISIQELRVKVRYDVQRYGLKLVGIDYAQLIRSKSKAAQGNRTQEMMDVSQGIDLLAQECGVPVIVLAQPKQETWGHRAGLNALGETSQLAKDADLVVMLGFWDVIEGKKKKAAPAEDARDLPYGSEDEEEPGDPRVFAYADVVKNRNGANTVRQPPIKLQWERDFYEFVSTNTRLYDPTGKEVQE